MSILSVRNVSKRYANGTHALENVNLEIREGEIFALLGPNGAGKTTLIGIIMGLVNASAGSVEVFGKNVVSEYRFTRSVIGCVPQEIQLDIFLPVQQVLENQRGFFGKPRNPKLIERLLKTFSLWDKRNDEIRSLSGGMKRRVLIAKALTNEPKILFLDEPTAGVDVELRKDMWEQIRTLKELGTTIILTTHYIEEAELLADRIGIINNGKLILVEEKETLMKRMGEKTLVLTLEKPLNRLPESLRFGGLALSSNGVELTYQYSVDDDGVANIIRAVADCGIGIRDITTKATSLEEIFVKLTEKS